MNLRTRIRSLENKMDVLFNSRPSGMTGVMVYDGDEAYPMNDSEDRYPLSELQRGGGYSGSHGVLLVPARMDRESWERMVQQQQADSMDFERGN